MGNDRVVFCITYNRLYVDNSFTKAIYFKRSNVVRVTQCILSLCFTCQLYNLNQNISMSYWNFTPKQAFFWHKQYIYIHLYVCLLLKAFFSLNPQCKLCLVNRMAYIAFNYCHYVNVYGC